MIQYVLEKIWNNLPNFKFKFEPEIEEKFKKDYIEKSLVFMRVAFFLALIIHFTFALFDNWALPESKEKVWFIRFVIVIPFLVAIMIFTFTKTFKKYNQLIVIITAAIVGWAMIAMIGVSKPYEMGYTYYYIGIILYVMAIYTVLGLRFWNCLITGILINVGYAFMAIFFQNKLSFNLDDVSMQIFINHNIFLFSANLVGSFAAYNTEKLFRADFLKKLQIEEEKKKVEARNEELQKQREELAMQKDMVEALNIEMSEKQQVIYDQKQALLELNEELILKNEEIQAQNEEIIATNAHLSEINHLLEKKSKHILDSIKYAQRIQNAMLPPADIYKKFFPESFVFNRAKDIVSGDFYWFHGTSVIKNSENYEKIYFALADSTGHGVPGAFMSMLCYNVLDVIIKDNPYAPTDKLLTDVSRMIHLKLQQHSYGETVNDGVDIAICCLDTTTLLLQYSGIRHPLLLVREKQLYEFKPESKIISDFDKNNVLYYKHLIQLKKGDMIYLFSDGYPDQFDKYGIYKFSMKRFRELLIEIVELTMEEQYNTLAYQFQNWKADSEQTDDVMVLGIRI